MSHGYPSKAAVIIVLLLVKPLSGQADGRPTLSWSGIVPRYSGFAEIQPVLLNSGSSPVFLSRIWPHGSAQLQRFNEATGEWESGRWSGGCGTVQKAFIPIEVPPHSERPIDLLWQLSTDDWDTPTHFVAAVWNERPLAGKYRLLLRYAHRPWTLGRSPGNIYHSLSPEFLISAGR